MVSAGGGEREKRSQGWRKHGEGEMSAVQIAEGEQRAEQWRAKNRAKSDNGGK